SRAVLNPIGAHRPKVRPRAGGAGRECVRVPFAFSTRRVEQRLHELGREIAAHQLLHPLAAPGRGVLDAHVRTGCRKVWNERALVGGVTRGKPGRGLWHLLGENGGAGEQHEGCSDTRPNRMFHGWSSFPGRTPPRIEKWGY